MASSFGFHEVKLRHCVNLRAHPDFGKYEGEER